MKTAAARLHGPKAGKRLLNSGKRLLNSGKRLLNSGKRLLNVEVTWRGRRIGEIDLTDWLARIGHAALAAEGWRRGQLSIAVVGARAMAELHRRFLGIAGPTDVLTFDLGSDARRGVMDAEIVVCADVARQRVKMAVQTLCRPRLNLRSAGGSSRTRNAAQGTIQSTVSRVAAMRCEDMAGAEIALYVVHGVLHLSGYDDQEPAAFQRMHQREDDLLEAFGLKRVFADGERTIP